MTHPVRILILTALLLWSLSLEAFALSPERPHPWDTCLELEAQTIDIPPALFRAIVYTESRNHPWAIAWTNHGGIRHSVFPHNKTHARQLLSILRQRQQNADVGLGQVNSTNWPTLAQRLNIAPSDLLEPCRNLTAARVILHEQLARHGYTWQALAGYNGSVGSPKYISLVHTNLCRQTPRFCTAPPRADDPLPTVAPTMASITDRSPEVHDQTVPITPKPDLQESEELDTDVAVLTQKAPDMTWMDTWTLSLSTTQSVLALSLNLLMPFAIIMACVVLICYGLLIMLWALGLVKDGIRSLLIGRPAFPIPVPAFLHSTSPTPSLHRRL
jgi:hypothetical protein